MNSIELFKKKFTEEVINSLTKEEEEQTDIELVSEYESENFGISQSEIYNNVVEQIQRKKEQKEQKIKEIINSFTNTLINFINTSRKSCNVPEHPDEENQYRILSFPWCLCGKLLSKMKYLS